MRLVEPRADRVESRAAEHAHLVEYIVRETIVLTHEPCLSHRSEFVFVILVQT
jgi:hypothetical protein